MSYTVALTKSGQMTLPKALRVFLGVDGAKSVRLEQTKNGVEIKRKLTQEEFLDGIERIHSKYGSKQKNTIDATEAVKLYRSGKITKLNDQYKEKYL